MEEPVAKKGKSDLEAATESSYGSTLNMVKSDRVLCKVAQILKTENTSLLNQSLLQYFEVEKVTNEDDPLFKYKALRRRLSLLLHSFLCKNTKCSIGHCWSRKNIWTHIVGCTDSKCEVDWCIPSKQILGHWIDCSSPNCFACSTFNKPQHLKERLEVSPRKINSSIRTTNKIKESNESHGSKNEKVWSGHELRTAFIPILDKLFSYEKESDPFMRPVDPVLDQCPDYFLIIRRPMDFGTILSKLERNVYTDPWEIVNDINLVFGNAWLYNKKCSIYHKYACKLADVFESCIDSIMRKLGFCCGQRYEFTPLPKYCDSRLWCNIPVLADYFSYNDQLVVDDMERYAFCERCFAESPTTPTVSVCKDPTSEPLIIEKKLFVKKKNLERKLERVIKCSNCGRLNHIICVMYLENVSSPFICQLCQSKALGLYKPVIYRAKDIPSSKLSDFIEARVRNFFTRRKLGSGEITIRTIASSKEITLVKPRFKKHFPQMSDEFPYMSKAIFAFQDLGDQDVCFFGMHVQEYGSEVPSPNTRRVYLAYLDSVQYFEPSGYRTSLYHEILLAYMQYIKNLGFVSLHIWSCPPCEGDDYIFNCHPQKQKIPKAKRLQEWYRKLLEKATNENVVTNFTDILSYAVGNDLKNAADMPYFDGDFWPTSLEDNLKEIEKSESSGEKSSSGKPPKSAQDTAAGNSQKQQNKGKKVAQSTHGDVLVDKIYSTLGKYREMFFVVEFFQSDEVATLMPIYDPDPIMPNDLMHERSSFLFMSRERQAEFSSLRRTKHSTLIMLQEILTNSNNSTTQSSSTNSNFSSTAFTCNICNSKAENFHICQVCVTWRCCPKCFELVGHHHETEVTSSRSGVDALEHASYCTDVRCTDDRCAKFKAAIGHTLVCEQRPNCKICKVIVRLAIIHAKRCSINNPSNLESNESFNQSDANKSSETAECSVVFCEVAKEKLHHAITKQRKMEERMLKRRTAAMMVVDENENDANADKDKPEQDFQRMGSI